MQHHKQHNWFCRATRLLDLGLSTVHFPSLDRQLTNIEQAQQQLSKTKHLLLANGGNGFNVNTWSIFP